MPRSPRDRDRVEHMLKAATEAAQFMEGRARSDLDTDRLLARATIHALLEIGEAARHVNETGRSRIPSLDWNAMVGMRNILVHVYWGIRLNVVWETVHKDLPPMISALADALAQRPEDPVA